MMTNATFVPALGHPLRRRLGLQARTPGSTDDRTPVRAGSDDDNDIKLFVLSYTAFFVCFYTFLM